MCVKEYMCGCICEFARDIERDRECVSAYVCVRERSKICFFERLRKRERERV
jgi:hypothetical protein